MSKTKPDGDHPAPKTNEGFFKTPPLQQNAQFGSPQQQLYYYYPPPIEQQQLQVLQSKLYQSNLMSPHQLSSVQNSQNQPAYMDNHNLNSNGQQVYYYPQQPIAYQYPSKVSMYLNQRANHKRSPYKQDHQHSPRKPKNQYADSRMPSLSRSPTKSKRGNSTINKNTNEISRMAPLTTNTNIKKKFIKSELQSYGDFLVKLDVDEDAKNMAKHDLVTKINTLNCLQPGCLKLLKEPVYDVLYVLPTNEFFRGESKNEKDSKRKENSNKDHVYDQLTGDVNIKDDQNDTVSAFDQITKSLQQKTDVGLKDILSLMSGTSIDSGATAISSIDSPLLNELPPAADESVNSGRMVVLDENTDFFVSSKGLNYDEPEKTSNSSPQKRKETTTMKRTLKSSNNFSAGSGALLNKNQPKTLNTLGDLRDLSSLRSTGSSNFNKLIETSPKKLMSQEKSAFSLSHGDTKRTSRKLLSKNDFSFDYKPLDHGFVGEDGSSSLDNVSLNEVDDSSFMLSTQSKYKPLNKKLRNLQNTNIQNASAMDLSFDGKAMNKSDLFKLIDSFEL